MSASEELLRAQNVSVEFAGRRQGGMGKRRALRAVDNVNLVVGRGETVGLAGESGSGKTTLGFTVLGRYRPVSGSVTLNGTEITGLKGEKLRRYRRQVQMIFQDPYSSLNPRMKVGEIVGEPLVVHGMAPERSALTSVVKDLLERCGLPPNAADRYPHAFSGGQRQRIAIARALAVSPSLIVADEPTSALDVSIQAQIINLLRDLQTSDGIAYLFITHNLAVLRQIADRVAIMYMGQIVEFGPTERIFEAPAHPYTRALLEAVPVPDARSSWLDDHQPLSGELPSPTDPPVGCRFNTRCPFAEDICFTDQPPFFDADQHHAAACWRLNELAHA